MPPPPVGAARGVLPPFVADLLLMAAVLVLVNSVRTPRPFRVAHVAVAVPVRLCHVLLARSCGARSPPALAPPAIAPLVALVARLLPFGALRGLVRRAHPRLFLPYERMG